MWHWLTLVANRKELRVSPDHESTGKHNFTGVLKKMHQLGVVVVDVALLLPKCHDDIAQV